MIAENRIEEKDTKVKVIADPPYLQEQLILTRVG